MWSRWLQLQLLIVTFAGFLSTGQSCCSKTESQPQSIPLVTTTAATTASHHVTSDATTEEVASGGHENTEAQTGTIVAISVGVGSGLIVITTVTLVIVFCLRHSASKQRQQNSEADNSPSKRIDSNPVDEFTDYYNCRSINPASPYEAEVSAGQMNKVRYVSSSGKSAATKFNDITLVDNDLYQG